MEEKRIVLRADNITKEFGGLRAIDNASLYLKENEILGLIGPNGAGKTTTMRMAMGLLARTALQAQSPSQARPEGSGSYQTESGATPLLFVGLPGNPVAAMVSYLIFVRPALQRLAGEMPPRGPLLLSAISGEPLRKRPGRTEYQRAVLSMDSAGQLQVRTTGAQGSAMLSSMVQANCLLVLEHERGNVAAGELVRVLPLQGLL